MNSVQNKRYHAVQVISTSKDLIALKSVNASPVAVVILVARRRWVLCWLIVEEAWDGGAGKLVEEVDVGR